MRLANATLEDVLDKVKNYCKRCDFEDNCPDRNKYIVFMFNEYSEKSGLDFVCTHATIANFAKKWPYKKP